MNLGGVLMQDYRRIRLTDWLINLTDETYHIYDDASGRIITLEPKQGYRLPPDEGKVTVHYIVTEDMLDAIKCSNCLGRFAVITDQSSGRDGIMIAHLVWAKDPKIVVRLRKSAHGLLTHHR